MRPSYDMVTMNNTDSIMSVNCPSGIICEIHALLRTTVILFDSCICWTTMQFKFTMFDFYRPNDLGHCLRGGGNTLVQCDDYVRSCVQVVWPSK